MSIRWRKSSYSGGSTAECVELAEIGAQVAVRDSKNPNGPRLALSRALFAALVAKIKNRH